MANTYSVAPSDVAVELPGLFPTGFTTSTLVTTAMVTNFIATADAMVTLALESWTGVKPLDTDPSAAIVRRYIVLKAVADVIRVAYYGQDNATTFSDIYATQATSIWEMLQALGAEADGPIVLPVIPGTGQYPIVSSFRITDGPAIDEYGKPPFFGIPT